MLKNDFDIPVQGNAGITSTFTIYRMKIGYISRKDENTILWYNLMLTNGNYLIEIIIYHPFWL